MAVQVKGVNFTKQETPKSTNIIDPGVWGGRVRVQYDVYTTDATETAGSTIAMAKLPVGATFLGAFIICGALGATAELELGDAIVSDRYMAAIVAHSNLIEARASAGIGYKVTGAVLVDSQELYLTTSVVTLAADETIQMVTFYTQD